VFYGLNPTTPWGKALKDLISAPTLDAARFGAVGAYLYVVLMLGQRGFQHDITSGAALWTSITLATGPLLSAVLARAWVGQGGGTSDSAWAVQTLYFVAGLSPRYVVDSIEALGKRLFFTRDSAPVNPRSPPLSLVMGMVPPIVDRLSEEGIYDVAGLSMADPQRLLRNTNFDKRQILDWIDQAILLRVLPTSAEALMNAGVSGAIDLVRYVSESSAPAHDVPAKGGPHESAPVAATVVPPPTRGLPLRGLAQLAERAGLTEELLWDCAVRLSEDTQVRIVWLLYQLDSD
jgi:hypothetical protein